MVDGLLGLRHDAIVGRHDQDHDVGHLRAARAHPGECFVPRGVDKDHRAASGRLDTRRADVLGDAASLLLGDAARADRVEKGGLAVIHMAHHGDHRRTRLQWPDRFFTLLTLVFDHFLGRGHHCFDFEVGTDFFRQLVREALVGGDHHSLLDQQTEEIFGGDVELFRQLSRRHHLREDDRSFGLLTILELDRERGTGRRGAALGVLAPTSRFLARTAARGTRRRPRGTRGVLLALEFLLLELVEKVTNLLGVCCRLRLAAGDTAGHLLGLAPFLNLALVGEPLPDLFRIELAQALLQGGLGAGRAHPLCLLVLALLAFSGDLLLGDLHFR